jgi:hypothetical protein
VLRCEIIAGNAPAPVIILEKYRSDPPAECAGGGERRWRGRIEKKLKYSW